MANGCDVDDVLVPLIKVKPVVTTAKPETSERRLELLHVAGAVGQVAIHAVENLHLRCRGEGTRGRCLCFPAVPWFPESALNEFQAHTTTPNGVALANEKSQFLDFHSSLALATALPCAERALEADHGSSKPGRRSALWSNVRVRAQPARVPSAPIRASANEPWPPFSATMAVKTSCSFSTMRTST